MAKFEVATKADRPGCKEVRLFMQTGWFPKVFYSDFEPNVSGDSVTYDIGKQGLLAKYCESKMNDIGNFVTFKIQRTDETEIFGYVPFKFGISNGSSVTVDCRIWGIGYAPQYQCDEAEFSDAEELELVINIVD